MPNPAGCPPPSLACESTTSFSMSSLSPPRKGTTTGYEVTRAHSLSAEWQVTSTSISSAPAIDAVDDGAEESEGLMLRIDGRGVVPSDDNEENGTGNGKGSRERETLEEMVRRFETGLADIRRAIESGRKFTRRRARGGR